MAEPTAEEIVQMARRAHAAGDTAAFNAFMRKIDEIQKTLPKGLVVLPTGKLGVDRKALGSRIREKELLPGWMGDLAYSFVQGQTANTLDEAFGAEQGAQHGEKMPIPGLDMSRSEFGREAARGRLEAANPVARTVGEIGGAVLSPLAKGLSGGKSLLDFITRGAIGGGLYEAAGEGSAGDRAIDAGVGAAVGGGGAAVLSKVAPYLANVGRSAKTVANQKLAEYLAQNAPYPGPAAATQGANAARMELGRARGAGQEGVFNLADAMGDAGQGALRATMSQPGAARSRAVEQLVRRQRGQSGRVAEYLQRGLETGGRTTDDWTRQLQGEINDVVRPKYQAIIDNAPSGVRLGMGRVKTTLGNMVANMKEDQLLANQQMAQSILKKIPEDSLTIARAHEVKLDLDQMVSEAYKAGNWRGGTVAKQVRDYFDDILERSVPNYRSLNAEYKGLKSAQEALVVGEHLRKAGDDAVPSIPEALKLVGPDNLPWLRKGLGSRLAAEVADMPAGADVSKRFGSLQMKQAIGDMDQPTSAPGAIPRPQNSMRLAEQLRNERTMNETMFRGVGGSRTDINLASAADLMQNLLKLDSSAGATFARTMHRLAATAQIGSNEQRIAELTRALLSKGPEARKVLAQATAAEKALLSRAAAIASRGGVAAGSQSDVVAPVLGYVAARQFKRGDEGDAQHQSTDYTRRDR